DRQDAESRAGVREAKRAHGAAASFRCATELPPVDSVVSLISWGWHYPVSTYLEPVRSALPPGGRLILHIRPRTGGEEELRRYFRYVGSYRGFGKCNKTVWQRRPV